MVGRGRKISRTGGGYWLVCRFLRRAAAWCKNEGLAFLLLVIFWGLILKFSWQRTRFPVRVGRFLVGMALTGSAVLVLKVVYAGKAHVLTGHSAASSSLFALLMDFERHRTILAQLGTSLPLFWNGWPLLLLAIAWGVHCLGNRQRIVHKGTLACAVVLWVIYYLVLVVTPDNLDWQLMTVLDRLILQFWPVFLVGLGTLFAEREDPCPERADNLPEMTKEHVNDEASLI